MSAVKEVVQQPLSREEQLERELEAFRRKLPQLLRRYRGEYVVIRKGRVVDHGQDDTELAFRMYKRFGNSVLLIAKVEERPTIYEIPSPEVVL
jgi:type II secretory pathway component PulJ